jgi:hypothetical protein
MKLKNKTLCDSQHKCNQVKLVCESLLEKLSKILLLGPFSSKRLTKNDQSLDKFTVGLPDPWVLKEGLFLEKRRTKEDQRQYI